MIDVARASLETKSIRKARRPEADRLAAILAHAFFDDPVMTWGIPDDKRRGKLLERSFGLYLRKLWFKQDECYTTDSLVGAIVWELPGHWKAGLVDQLRLLPSMALINGRLLPRILRGLSVTESNHPAALLPAIGRRRAGVAGPRARYRADAPGSRPLRSRRSPGLS